ncbi:MAG: serine/threonine protein phosphatase, partial [Alphaproteobacteria bacterium]
AREIELRPNRIGIDTGLVYGRHLTCLVLEDDRLWSLESGGRRALDRP